MMSIRPRLIARLAMTMRTLSRSKLRIVRCLQPRESVPLGCIMFSAIAFGACFVGAWKRLSG
jgi:hypothetical protein